MTLRAKPVVKGPGRSGWNSEDRRTTLTNVGFVVVIAVSILILIGYAAFSLYDDHFGAAAKVDGAVITRDQLRSRAAIETFRIDYTESRIRTLQTAGQITEASASQELQYLEQARSSIDSSALEHLIDTTLQAKLASQEGVTVSDADVSAQLVSEATIPEQRHVWVIEFAPQNNAQTGKPGDAEKAAAKAKADLALADLKAGKAWEDVAKTTSTAASAAQGGDLGWMAKDSGYDVPLMTAVFAAEQGKVTDVIEGDDGTYRIGRATEIAPATVDSTYQTRIQDAGIKLDDYRAVVRGDVVRKQLDAKVVADLSKPSLQRHLLQILLAEGTPMPDGVKVRHILISPNHNPGGAGVVPLTDPAWKKAEDEANAIYQQVLKDPTQFDELARTKSDEGAAKTSGGKLPFYDSASQLDKDFLAQITKPGLKPGDILPPFKSAFGWHVVQFMRPYGDGDAAWLKTIRDQAAGGADFAQLARDQGDGPEAADGGDIGWVAKGQLGIVKETAIFAAPVGGLTDVVTVAKEGVYLWKVVAEEQRAPTKEQIKAFESSGFSDWYTAKKAAAKIERLTAATSTTQ
jgi:parvulin-like peptidyl-prolyl isomerase